MTENTYWSLDHVRLFCLRCSHDAFSFRLGFYSHSKWNITIHVDATTAECVFGRLQLQRHYSTLTCIMFSKSAKELFYDVQVFVNNSKIRPKITRCKPGYNIPYGDSWEIQYVPQPKSWEYDTHQFLVVFWLVQYISGFRCTV